MVVVNVLLLSTCIALSISLLTLLWNVFHYKTSIENQVKRNQQAIERQGRNFKYAYRILENDVFDIQGFLIKTTDYKIRARAEVPGNSGADFLEESEKDNESKT